MKHSKLALLLLLSSVFACEKDQVGLTQENLFGFWRYQSGINLQVFDNQSDLFPIAHLELLENLTMNGFTSRNTFNGTYTYNDSGNIQLNIQAMTRVADTPWSAEFTNMLEAVRTYRIEENQLILTDPESGNEYTFLKINDNTCRPVINDREAYANAQTDPYDLLEINTFDTCLEVLIGYGGGCRGIEIELIGAEDYAESEPPQLGVKIVVDDDDMCEAYIREYFYFDLTELQYEDSDQLILNIDSWKDQIIINYE